MKAHKYWGIASLIFMIGCMYSGSSMKSKDAHKFFAGGAFGCMLMAICTGHIIVSCGHKKKAEEAETEDVEETAELAEA